MHYSEIEKYCKNCNKILILKNNRDIIKKNFCSFSCNGSFQLKTKHRSDPSFTQRLIKLCNTPESNKKKGIQPNRIITYKTHICVICNHQFNVQLNRHNKGYGICCSKKCYKQYHHVDDVKFQCINCRIEIWDKPRKNRKYCSCSCRAIQLLPTQKFSNTDIELKIKSFLEENKIQFDFQPLIQNIVNTDFLIYPNIVIFADGDYWHNLPYAIERDKIVNEKLIKNDYVVLRFRGKDIKNNFELVKNKIMETYNA